MYKMDGSNGKQDKKRGDFIFTKKRVIIAVSLMVLVGYGVGMTTQMKRPHAMSNASKTKESVNEATIEVLQKSVNEASKPDLEDVLTKKAEVDWTPYMDVLDENEALRDPPLNDVRNGVDIELSKVYLQERKNFYEVGDTINLRIDLYDGYGNRRTRGGDQLRVRIFEESLNAFACGYVVDHKNGSFTAKLKCLWAGTPTILVHVAYTREAVRALYEIRRTLSSTRDTYATYKNNATGLCHAFKKKLNQSKGVCDMTSKNGNMSWYCEAPGTTSKCPPLQHFFLMHPFPALGITFAEETMFRMNGNHLNPPLTIVVKEESTMRKAPNKPKCVDYDRTKLWFQASPIGHYMHNVWEPEHCQMTPVDRFRGCLENKHLLLYGDSTIRQWFTKLSGSLNCKITSEAWTQEKWKKDSAAFCPQMNLTIEWIVHEFPGNIDPVRTDVNSISGNMLKFARNKDAIFVIHLLCHLSAYHHDVFRDRIAHVRKSAEAILKVNKDAKILIKGGHTFGDRRQISDYYSYVYRTIMIEEFQGLYDKVVYLDNKDLTAAKNVIPNHPNDIVVTQMVNQMLSYICE